MKKIIAALIALTLFSTSVFAIPASKAEAFVQVSSAVSETRYNVQKQRSTDFAISAFEEDDTLFASVKATELTDEEAAYVEGEGWLGAIIGGIAGAVSGVFGGINAVSNVYDTWGLPGNKGGWQIGGGIVGGIAGGIGGVIGGMAFPFF